MQFSNLTWVKYYSKTKLKKMESWAATEIHIYFYIEWYHPPSVANCSRCFKVISLYFELSARRS